MYKLYMDFSTPSHNGFTIYSKSGCINCVKAKRFLHDKQLLYKVVNCDEYIIEDKPAFLYFMNTISGTNVVSFPMIFCDNKFIGGFVETIVFTNKLLLDIDDTF
jgi:glutaredoxin